MSTSLRTTGLYTLLVLLLAACGGDTTPQVAEDPADQTEAPATEPATPAPTTDAAGTSPDEPTEEAPSAEPSVAVAATALGDVLVDGAGMTLYLFERDAQGASTCDDACAEAWPPHVVDGDPVAGDGVDSALLGTANRPDGPTQVTYDGWPLYRWAGDESPGDTNGQGVQDVWWVVAPDGTPIRDDASASRDY